MRTRLRGLTQAALMTAVTVVMAQVSIPLYPGLPFTMQTFAVMLTGLLLNAKYAALSAIVYLLIGAAGLPVFSGFRSAGALAGPTGGFLISFPIAACVISCLARTKGGKRRVTRFAACLLGLVFVYALGTAQFSFVTHTNYVTVLGINAPFMLLDAVKALIAVLAVDVINMGINGRRTV